MNQTNFLINDKTNTVVHANPVLLMRKKNHLRPISDEEAHARIAGLPYEPPSMAAAQTEIDSLKAQLAAAHALLADRGDAIPDAPAAVAKPTVPKPPKPAPAPAAVPTPTSNVTPPASGAEPPNEATLAAKREAFERHQTAIEKLRVDGKKKPLEAYAKKHFGVDLDTRFNISKMANTAVDTIAKICGIELEQA